MRAQMDGTLLVDGSEHLWAASLNTLDDPPAFLRSFAMGACGLPPESGDSHQPGRT
jgi:hypothetical protein